MSADVFSERHTCIFVGAGCSKALFDVPIQPGLVDCFLSWDEQHNARPHLSQRLRRLLGVTKDIELIASHYHSLAYPKDASRNRGLVREFLLLRVALAQYLDDAVRSRLQACASSSENLLRSFLTIRNLKMSDLFIVSTNYDCVLENLLEGIFGDGSYWYPGVSTQRRTDAIPVFKLHGSINWMEDRGPISQDRFMRAGKPVLIAAPSVMELRQSSGEHGYFFGHANAKHTPIIIPFVFQKEAWLKEDNPDWKRIFIKTWNLAEDLMKRSNRLLFWGYSLPAADYHMFSLLIQVLDRPDAYFEVVDKGNAMTNMIRVGELFHERAIISRDGLSSYLQGENYAS
jgi:hypothetical protein